VLEAKVTLFCIAASNRTGRYRLIGYWDNRPFHLSADKGAISSNGRRARPHDRDTVLRLPPAPLSAGGELPLLRTMDDFASKLRYANLDAVTERTEGRTPKTLEQSPSWSPFALMPSNVAERIDRSTTSIEHLEGIRLSARAKVVHILAEVAYRLRFVQLPDSKTPWAGLQLSLHRRTRSGLASTSPGVDGRLHHPMGFHSDGLFCRALDR